MLRSAFPVSRTYRKHERLCSEVTIGKIFKSSTGFFIHPFKVLYLNADEGAIADKLLISVPKRNFKKAVDRNLLKRRIKEAYRLNKGILHQHSEMPFLAFALIFVGKKILEFGEIEEKVKVVLGQLYLKHGS